jgi:hypothetical protein
MAEGCVVTGNKNTKIQGKSEELIEMDTFKSNIKAECGKSNKKTMFKIVCVSDYYGCWSKRVYIQDYIDGTIRKNPNNDLIIGADIALKSLYDKSGEQIRIQVWNINEIATSYPDMFDIYYRHSDGVIVFCAATSESMDSALKWKHHISQALGQDIPPFVLIVDNVCRTTAWMGQGLVMNSSEEMDSFCREHGFFAWFEMLQRVGGEKSVFGQAVSTLINKIISRNNTQANIDTRKI